MIRFDPAALDDLERIFEFNWHRDPSTASEHIGVIRSALDLLREHPEIGRRHARQSTLRELVISYGRTGYLALYEFVPHPRTIRVVAIRHQREAGYRSGW